MSGGGETRQAEILGGFAGEQLDLERLTASERISDTYEVAVDVISPISAVDFTTHLGKPLAVAVKEQDGVVRHFHGLVFEAHTRSVNRAGYHYTLVLRPWLHFLKHGRNFAIFQDLDSLDVIRKVFETYGFSDFDFSAVNPRPGKRPYCVQYDETDFDFVNRVLEEDGLFYHFLQKEDRHVMVVSAKPAQAADDGLDQIRFWPVEQAGSPVGDVVMGFEEVLSTGGEGKVILRGFDFTKANSVQVTNQHAPEVHPHDKVLTVVYPEHHDAPERSAADRGSRLLDTQRAERALFRGRTNAGAIFCGSIIEVVGHDVARLDQLYMVTALTYVVDAQHFRSGEMSGGQAGAIDFEAAPANVPWKPQFRAPRPRVYGPETAVVTGPSDQVIHTDEHGRVKVRFHWDRGDTPNEKSTCWLRVSHHSAGVGFGHVILPRIGQEVIVDFLSGDPDQPIVTGRVYNSVNTLPYPLPANSTRSVWKSQTIGEKGEYPETEKPPGSEKGSNEIRLEDKGGKEEVYVHAQRDMLTWVRFDDEQKVGHDQKERVGRDRTVSIKRHLKTTLDDGDETRTLTKGKRTTTIQSDETLTIKQGNQATTLDMGNQDTKLKMGNYSLKADLGTVTVEAMQSITLKVGSNSIKIDQTGVTIKGIMVKIEGAAMLQAKAPLTQIDGTGMVMVKGGVIMLN